jgi:hypothetical protein
MLICAVTGIAFERVKTQGWEYRSGKVELGSLRKQEKSIFLAGMMQSLFSVLQIPEYLLIYAWSHLERTSFLAVFWIRIPRFFGPLDPDP